MVFSDSEMSRKHKLRSVCSRIRCRWDCQWDLCLRQSKAMTRRESGLAGIKPNFNHSPSPILPIHTRKKEFKRRRVMLIKAQDKTTWSEGGYPAAMIVLTSTWPKAEGANEHKLNSASVWRSTYVSRSVWTIHLQLPHRPHPIDLPSRGHRCLTDRSPANYHVCEKSLREIPKKKRIML